MSLEIYSNNLTTMGQDDTSDYSGISLLVLSQMIFPLVGTLANNLLLITLKVQCSVCNSHDHRLQTMPDLSASTHHFLLANLCLTNVISCTILKPASAVYISYAYAKVVYLKV